MHVFTYGTLMFPEVWQAVVGRQFNTVAGTAAGYAIYCVQGAVFPGIVAAAERDAVPGVVYLDVDVPSLARLDLFEDVFYQRKSIWVDCDDGQRRAADAYVVPAESCSVLSGEAWSREQFIAQGHLDLFIRRFAGFSRLSGGD